MHIVRPAGPGDIDALLDLAYLSGKGFTSLPENRELLAERLALSQSSFAGTVPADEAWYVLMLTDTATGAVEGVAGIKGSVGIHRPHASFRIVTLAQYSPATKIRFDHQALVLVNECSGYSEVGSLFLRPARRQAGAGALLARSRYALMAMRPDLFGSHVMAELRGWFDEQDESPFWKSIASKFFRLPFEEADRMITATDGQFVLDLAPRHPIYLELVDPQARDAIGAVHRHGVPALEMLMHEGFTRSGLIDIFDGGPTVVCERQHIGTIAKGRSLPAIVAPADAPQRDAGRCLVASGDLANFRAISTTTVKQDSHVALSGADMAALGIQAGQTVFISPPGA